MGHLYLHAPVNGTNLRAVQSQLCRKPGGPEQKLRSRGKIKGFFPFLLADLFFPMNNKIKEQHAGHRQHWKKLVCTKQSAHAHHAWLAPPERDDGPGVAQGWVLVP